MFEEVVVGVRDDDAGPDAIALAKEMASAHGELTLVHVHVVANKPAPDSVGDAAKCRYALERLTALRAEFSLDAEVSCVEARSVRRGLHEFASARDADLLVVGASHNDELARDFVGDHTREVLQEAPCAVAVAPAGYAARAAAMRRIGVAYDGSAESERALALGRRLAAERHAELSAFEAVFPSVGLLPPASFVCLHKAGRSQMSQALFEQAAKRAGHRRLAGTTPADRVHLEVVEATCELGVDLADRRPQLLARDLAQHADVVLGVDPTGLIWAWPKETSDEDGVANTPASSATTRLGAGQIYPNSARNGGTWEAPHRPGGSPVP